MNTVAEAVSTNVYKLGVARSLFTANYSLPAREAVRNAYAQFERKDFNTWDYAKYDSLVKEGEHSFTCGDYIAFKNN